MIKLRTECTRANGVFIWTNASNDNLYHDCAVAHAYQEATSEVCGGVTDNRILVAIGVIETRAAEKLKEWGVE